MVLLEERIAKICFKLENHHHHHHHRSHGHHHHDKPPEVLSTSLQAFRSDVLSCLNQLLLNSKPGSEILSLEWIQHCFELFPCINRAFAKLVVDVDYPMNKWEAALVDEYLNYSLNLLEFLNCISSSLSHLGQARLSLSYALSLLENSPSMAVKHLKVIQVKSLNKDLLKERTNRGDGEEQFCSEEEKVIHQALEEIESIGFWVSGVVLASLSGDAKPYLEIKKYAAKSGIPSLIDLDLCFSRVMVEQNGELKEVRELNRAAASLESAIVERKSNDAAEELEKKVNVFEKLIDNLGKEVDDLFSRILASRNGLLDGVGGQNQ
ncbi:hypothetical protein SLA2020_138650 [Shorea laevis]